MARRWVLARRPEGRLRLQDFALESAAPPTAPLAPGEVEVEPALFLCAPTMRNWLDPPGRSLYPSLALGEPVLAPMGGRVVASAAPGIPIGARVTGFGRWAERCRVDVAAGAVERAPDGTTLIEAMGLLGLNSLTAYFGMTRVAEPRPGETVLVSGAAGSVGSMAAQIARIMGARVIGVAGGAAKCGYLLDALRLDAAVDYKAEELGAALDRLAPEGIDVLFDNVGGAVLDAAVDRMRRIALCGQIAGYDGAPVVGPRNMMRLIYGSVRMQGFLMGDYAAGAPAARAQLREWAAAGAVVYRDDIRDGFESLPSALIDLFEGRNAGTLLVRVSPDADAAA